MKLETNPPNPDLSPVSRESQRTVPAGERFVPSWKNLRAVAIFTVVLIVLFARPLFALIQFAPQKELYSHILLIPFISAYLIWIKRDQIVPESRPNRLLALLPLAI